MNRVELEQLDREALVALAEQAGVSRARVLTRPELVDELLLRSAVDQATKQRSRGLFGRARDLLARVVERGLHLPDAADRIRSLGAPIVNRPSAPAALPTVTLAEIYAAQGHRLLAIETLERVLAQEPDHGVATALLSRLADADYPVIAPRLPPEDDEPAPIGVQEGDPAGPPAEPTHMLDDAPLPSGPPAEPMHMLDDAPLPPLYDVDECVAMPVDPVTLYVYWEIRGSTLEQVRAARPNATVALRVVAVVPTWDGPRSTIRDQDVIATLGDFFVRDLPGGSTVRVAVGLRDAGGFEPIAHCASLEMPAGAPCPFVADTLVRWTPDGAAAEVPRSAAATAQVSRSAAAEVPRSAAATAQVSRAAAAEVSRSAAGASLGASEAWLSERSRTS